jgi:hypothetical protein
LSYILTKKTTSMQRLSILLIGLVFTLTSCQSYQMLTQDMVDQYNWSEGELKQIQFYSSEDIVLRQVQRGKKTSIEDGEVNVQTGKEVREIVIKKGTQGVMLFQPSKNQIAVSFDAEDDSKFLIFGPNPKADGRYLLLASQWDKRKGKVTYGNTKYYVDANRLLSGLLIDIKRQDTTKFNSKQAKGRKVGQ